MKAARTTYGPHPVPPLRGKQLAALRSVAATPGGLRITAYPSVMPLLEQMGMVRIRDHGRSAWLLTEAGRRTVRSLGLGEP